MRKRYIVTILTALAIVAYMAVDDQHTTVEIVSQDLVDQEPDYIVHGLSADSFSEDGHLSQQINAVTATHYPADDITVLEKPALILYEAGNPKWGVRSESGRLLKQKDIHLTGDVIIVPLHESGGDFSLTTASLYIDLASQMADTDDKVSIESDSSELLATGMTIFLDKQLVTFKSQVRGRHDPKAQ
ncbi:MAG: LPS export ABC transporter periplasmic protein LptC [Gammaproteobacteria bacterium]|nr:LPS export ABC transporter periplasmic protein LptC [Gammaproteobacteria bacterium]